MDRINSCVFLEGRGCGGGGGVMFDNLALHAGIYTSLLFTSWQRRKGCSDLKRSKSNTTSQCCHVRALFTCSEETEAVLTGATQTRCGSTSSSHTDRGGFFAQSLTDTNTGHKYPTNHRLVQLADSGSYVFVCCVAV